MLTNEVTRRDVLVLAGSGLAAAVVPTSADARTTPEQMRDVWERLYDAIWREELRNDPALRNAAVRACVVAHRIGRQVERPLPEGYRSALKEYRRDEVRRYYAQLGGYPDFDLVCSDYFGPPEGRQAYIQRQCATLPSTVEKATVTKQRIARRLLASGDFFPLTAEHLAYVRCCTVPHSIVRL